MAAMKRASLTAGHLKHMAQHAVLTGVSDKAFLTALAVAKCIVVPPYVMRVHSAGGLSKVAKITFDDNGSIDKASVLMAVARFVRENENLDLGGRLKDLDRGVI